MFTKISLTILIVGLCLIPIGLVLALANITTILVEISLLTSITGTLLFVVDALIDLWR